MSAEPTTPADVEQGLRNWIAAANQAFATGDTKALRALSEPKCPCIKIADFARDQWAHGSIHGLVWTLKEIHVIDMRYDLADVQYDYEEPTFWVIASGRRSPSHHADRVTVLSEFQRTSGVWRMAGYIREEATSR